MEEGGLVPPSIRARRGPGDSSSGPRPARISPCGQGGLILALVLLGAAVTGTLSCGGGLRSSGSGSVAINPIGSHEIGSTRLAVVSRNYRAAFQTLESAIRLGDDELAWGILARLKSTPLDPRESELAQSLELVLRGRKLAQSVSLELEITADDSAEGRWQLSLRVSQVLVDELTLRLPPVRLIHRRHRIDELGVGSQQARTRLLPVLESVRLTRGDEQLIPLETFEVPMQSAVAMRDEWELELLGGFVEFEGQELPANAFTWARLERAYLAAFLPQEPLDPAVLVEYAGRENPAMAPLIERAVRIPPSRSEEALEALEPLLIQLTREDPERCIALVPALRWLARTSAPGVHPSSWVRYIRSRRERASAHEPRALPGASRLMITGDPSTSQRGNGRGALILPPGQGAGGDDR
ncbi:MAG: hypothetical protein ACI8QS_000617 [Planctomycetota bacterium]|jgi:hypothetical protein